MVLRYFKPWMTKATDEHNLVTYVRRSTSDLSCSTSCARVVAVVAILIAEKQIIYVKIYYISRNVHLILLIHHFLQLFGRVFAELIARKVLLFSFNFADFVVAISAHDLLYFHLLI